jgi:formate dehydrogenase maturation protein FdhE
MSGEFKNEVFQTYEPNPVQHCNACGEKPVLVRAMLDSLTGRTVRMFKCKCGEQTWTEARV